MAKRWDKIANEMEQSQQPTITKTPISVTPIKKEPKFQSDNDQQVDSIYSYLDQSSKWHVISKRAFVIVTFAIFISGGYFLFNSISTLATSETAVTKNTSDILPMDNIPEQQSEQTEQAISH